MKYEINNNNIIVSCSSLDQEDLVFFKELLPVLNMPIEAANYSTNLIVFISKKNNVAFNRDRLPIEVSVSSSLWEFSFCFTDEFYDIVSDYEISFEGKHRIFNPETQQWELQGGISLHSKNFTVYKNFLSDFNIVTQEGKTLFLQYNPELTNYKYHYEDSVTTTLGGKYPVIRRNGQQKYRSFQIGALIALSAENIPFLSENAQSLIQNIELYPIDNYSKQAYKEKIVRDEILSCLMSDKIVLFRSGPEGNIIVRLTNVSLTPNKTLDRNIYNFTATATEVLEGTEENWKNLRILERGSDYARVRPVEATD